MHSDSQSVPQINRTNSQENVLMVITLAILVIVCLFLIIDINNRLSDLERSESQTREMIVDLNIHGAADTELTVPYMPTVKRCATVVLPRIDTSIYPWTDLSEYLYRTQDESLPWQCNDDGQLNDSFTTT